MSQDIIGQLKKLKKNPEAGWASSDVHARTRHSLMKAIRHAESAEGAEGLRGGAAYYRWILGQFISKPVVAGAMAFVLICGGWMTSVNAASSSLPGDALYSLKLATERARIQLASSEHRAILHTEFAQRRYEEAVAISHTPEKAEFVEGTLNAFKEQIELANNQLQRLKDEGSDETIEVATKVDQKIGELNSVIDGVASQSSNEESISKVADARETTQGAENAALDAIVDVHEHAEPANAKEELDELFQKELAELRTREAFDLGRLAVIRSTLDSQAELLQDTDLEISETLTVLEFNVTSTAAMANDAMDLAAAGGYRTAFDILRDANTDLLDIENRLALNEITLMNTIADARRAQEQEEEQAAEEQQTTESTSETIDSSEDG